MKVTYNLILLVISFLLFSSISLEANQKYLDAIIELPENENAIIVEKKSQTLSLYNLKSGNLLIDFQVSCSTGEVEGIKEKAGDKKTPEGVYFLNNEYEDKFLSPIYGKKAFPTDYPNFLDKKSGKNGSAIWIHGTNKKLKPLDSNGCVALENSNILQLAKYINLDSTPVIMVDTITMVDKDQLKKQKKDINDMIIQWNKAVETGSYHDYLSFYSFRYLPQISWWADWYILRSKKKSGQFNSALKLEIDQLGIYHHDQVFVAIFDYYLTFETKKILLGKRKLFLEHQKDNYKIIGDVFQKKSDNFQDSKNPLITASTTVFSIDNKGVVLKIIQQWLAAWSAKDMKTYASFYANHFYSDGLNKKKWVGKKQKLAKKYDYINISGQAFQIKFKKQTCEVIFFQKYESSGFTTEGMKKLKLVNKGGLWKIYQESWKGK